MDALQHILAESSRFEKNYSTYVKRADAIASDYYKYSTTQLDTDTSTRILEEMHAEVAALVGQEFHQIQTRKGQQIIDELEGRLRSCLKRPDLITILESGR